MSTIQKEGPLFLENKIVNMRNWTSWESNVYPLYLNREPSSYVRQCSTFIVSTTNEHYDNLKQLIQSWYEDSVKPGKSTTLKMNAKFDHDWIEPKSWYVIDLRKQPDKKWKNVIILEDFLTLPEAVQNRLAFELFEAVKGLVIFADDIMQIPTVWLTMSVWGLSEGNSVHLTHFIRNGCTETPQNFAIYKNSSKLAGYHRMENMPTYVEFPPDIDP